jgi:hypothetical protein
MTRLPPLIPAKAGIQHCIANGKYSPFVMAGIKPAMT